MSAFWVGTLIAIVAGILAITGYILVNKPKYEKLGLILVVTGILLGFISHGYVYFNGTESDIIRWMFWTR